MRVHQTALTDAIHSAEDTFVSTGIRATVHPICMALKTYLPIRNTTTCGFLNCIALALQRVQCFSLLIRKIEILQIFRGDELHACCLCKQ